MLTRTPWTPPGDLDAEANLVVLACVGGGRKPSAIWTLRPDDFADHRHAALWRVATAHHVAGTDPTADDLFRVASSGYVAWLIVHTWPTDTHPDTVATKAERWLARVRDAATTRRMLDACWHLCAAWSDDDKARWQAEIAKIAAAASGKDAPPDRSRTASTYAARALRYEATP